ncbi:MAG TPA: hypothetical protein VIJ25_19230, partial [Methylococcales bacterium]
MLMPVYGKITALKANIKTPAKAIGFFAGLSSILSHWLGPEITTITTIINPNAVKKIARPHAPETVVSKDVLAVADGVKGSVEAEVARGGVFTLEA